MTEQQAREKGYSYTGAYERFKDELNDDIQRLKKQGYKCAIVTVPDSKLSRGPISCGYSIYAEQRYFNDKRIADLKQRLGWIEGQKTRALEKYEAELQKIEEDRVRMEAELEKIAETEKV